ncbi:MAG: hypothetical protein H7296_02590 [Bacteroidia bacterium]|nr:hypothetical protein [Bacteroidia bacterium]
MDNNTELKSLDDFLIGKSDQTIELFNYFVMRFQEIGNITLIPAKSMIGIATPYRRIAWVTQLGKNFIHVVFPFERPFEDNMCFLKIAKVPGDDKQYNHHFRMLYKADINEEIIKFMRLAYDFRK